MKNYRINTSFVSPEDTQVRANKTGINLMILILIFKENCKENDTLHDFSVQLRTSSNPADINLFGNHTGQTITCEPELDSLAELTSDGGIDT